MTEPTLTLLEAGSLVHPEHVILRTGRLRPMRFPALFALIEHPAAGVVLFDTGHSQHFVRATRRLPERLYTLLAPLTLGAGDGAVDQLRDRGLSAADVRHVVVSHFHADHVAGLKDFPRATFHYLGAAWSAVRGLTGMAALWRAYLPDVIPSDFEARSRLVEGCPEVALPPECTPFLRGYDLFGDGALCGVPLPGHATGQLGLMVRTRSGPHLLVADACWTSQSYRAQILPHPLARLVFADGAVYADTLARLGELHRRAPSVPILPSHCAEVAARYVGRTT